MSNIQDVARSAFNIEGCMCQKCVHEVISKRPFPDNLMYPFIVCPDCGNKRCPKATFHDNDCTRSNEPGQEGSSYPAVDWNAKPKTHEELMALIESWDEEEDE